MDFIEYFETNIALDTFVITRGFDSETSKSIPLFESEEISIVTQLIDRITFIFDGTNLYYFNGKFYDILPPEQFRAIIKKIYHSVRWKYNLRKGNEILKQLQDEVFKASKLFNDYKNKIPIDTGIYAVGESIIIQEKREEFYFTYYFPYPFIITTQAPKIFNDFLQKLIPDKLKQDIVLAFIAYCLLPTLHIQKALILYGKRGTGKSVLTDLLFVMFGDKVTEVNLQGLIDNRFETGKIHNKLLAIGSEMPNKRITEIERFKSLVTDNYIPVEKKYSQPITAKNITRFIFTANLLPTISNNIDDSFFRRLIMIHTPNVILAEERDPELLEKLIFELPGIFNFLLTYVPRINEILLPKNIEQDIRDMKKAFMNFGDATSQFIHERCHIDFKNNYQIESDLLYNLFNIYCQENRFETISKEYFGRRLSEMGIINIKSKNSFSEEYEHYYKNIILLSELQKAKEEKHLDENKKNKFLTKNQYFDMLKRVIQKIGENSKDGFSKDEIITLIKEKKSVLSNNNNFHLFEECYMLIIAEFNAQNYIYQPNTDKIIWLGNPGE